MNPLCFFSRHKPVVVPLRLYEAWTANSAWELSFGTPAPTCWQCSRCGMPLSDPWQPPEPPKEKPR